MKISNTTPPLRSDLPTPATTNGRSAGRASGTAASAPQGAAAPATSVSTTAVASDFNAQKVQSVSTAIANGSYRVNSGTIADKLLGNVAELAKRK